MSKQYYEYIPCVTDFGDSLFFLHTYMCMNYFIDFGVILLLYTNLHEPCLFGSYLFFCAYPLGSFLCCKSEIQTLDFQGVRFRPLN